MGNRDAVLDILHKYFILPRPVYKAHVSREYGTLEISGGGLLRMYALDESKLPTTMTTAEDDPTVTTSDPEGSDPAMDDFDYEKYGQEVVFANEIIRQLGELIRSSSVWAVHLLKPTQEAAREGFYTMQTLTSANVNGQKKFITSTAYVPAPRHPTVIVMEGGSLTGVLTDAMGPVVVYDHDEHPEDRGSASFSKAGYYGASPFGTIDDELVEDVQAALKDHKHDGEL